MLKFKGKLFCKSFEDKRKKKTKTDESEEKGGFGEQ